LFLPGDLSVRNRLFRLLLGKHSAFCATRLNLYTFERLLKVLVVVHVFLDGVAGVVALVWPH
jgi:hypothetical protein